MTNAGKGKTLDIDLDEDAGDGEIFMTPDDNAIIDEDAGAAGSKVDDDIVDEDINPDEKLPSHAVQNGDGSVTLPLEFPQKIGVKKDGKVRFHDFAALTFHRMNGADQRAVAAANAETSVVVAFSRSTRINQAIMNKLFDKMDMADITDCGRVLNHFLTSGRKTGR